MLCIYHIKCTPATWQLLEQKVSWQGRLHVLHLFNRNISMAPYIVVLYKHTHADIPSHLPRLFSLFSQLPRPLSLALCKCMCHFIPRQHLFFMEVNCMATLCAELCLCNPHRWPLITWPSTPPTHQQLQTSTPTLPQSFQISPSFYVSFLLHLVPSFLSISVPSAFFSPFFLNFLFSFPFRFPLSFPLHSFGFHERKGISSMSFLLFSPVHFPFLYIPFCFPLLPPFLFFPLFCFPFQFPFLFS